MARTPTVYRCDDPGAPDLNAIMPTSNDKKKLWLYTVLKACLVDGYGSKAAAGWEVVGEEFASLGIRFAIRNAAGSGVFMYEGGTFSGSNDLDVSTIWVADDIVGSMDSPVNAWSGRSKYSERSTSNNFHAMAGVQGGGWGAWMVVANENSAILYCLRESGSFDISSGYSVSRGYEDRLFIGAADQGSGLSSVESGNFLVFGGVEKGALSSSTKWQAPGDNVVSWTRDILGLSKGSAHGVFVYFPTVKNVSVNPPQFVPNQILISQYGSSGPDGGSSGHLYHLAALVGVRLIGLKPVTVSLWNSWLSSMGVEYGVPFNFAGSSWVAVKYLTNSVELVCIDGDEWGV